MGMSIGIGVYLLNYSSLTYKKKKNYSSLSLGVLTFLHQLFVQDHSTFPRLR